ncbi:hypothetical protein C9927_01635 [Pseudidiomarina aestuarii]|uniref:DUF6868 domain-containing protein n=1 Tax=Pseudidiomarina aestuarii TaxID=624146 RepID=A0A2T4D6Y8_9GAMM|nr:hypothetical protein C9988_03750 [Pseudidiomarina aestuarii]PTB89238.1 hypothetical protein C9928_04290 [Pseudidiomarina aestuarii]PTB89585.1 hypothetical protein C9927_01635 [Pseudidiomarina aestuarii]
MGEWKEVLLWCWVVNYGVLALWFVVLTAFRERLYNLHGKWFPLSRESFDQMHYMSMAIYKVLVIVFFLVPWIVMEFVIR